MASLAEYYGRAKAGGLMDFGAAPPKDATELGENMIITAVTGVGVGLASAALGGLDKKIAGIPVPVDGLISLGLGLAAVQTHSKTFAIASVAAGGSAAVRTFESFFKRGLKVKGEFEDLGGGMTSISGMTQYGQHTLAGAGFGAGEQDALVAAARYL